MLLRQSLFIICTGSIIIALPARLPSNTTIQLDDGVFHGVTSGIIRQYLGIPYAKPPVGNLRLRLPEAYPPYNGTYDATAFGHMCPNQFPEVLPTGTLGRVADKLLEKIWVQAYPSSEDCLTVNIVTPINMGPAAQLPVVVWIYGGGFTMGDTQEYHGVVMASVHHEPVHKPVLIGLGSVLGPNRDRLQGILMNRFKPAQTGSVPVLRREK
ncbi:hypothetical protein FRB94_002469 [Tulasnella sp. JGI-2019a]|nr:hypothetical protein FRB93_003976 [Tulasnella sp. JGI-2019a]KAG9004249.1 hypothetical protein FRB94_002469 [Tulasnella sp. JGI-2019a]